MDWVDEFYTRQGEWSNVYSGNVSESDRVRVSAIERLAGPGPKRILELGAGGGQSAAAAADLGYNVLAVELVAGSAAHARDLASQPHKGTLEVIQSDFYEVQLTGDFDVVCYWDGFGIGSDEDQRRLLTRIKGWLKVGGCALIDVYTPWYWANVAGREISYETTARRYGFDAEGCRMIDRWWPLHDESQSVMQSLRCYSPEDLRLLLASEGLELQGVEPGGAMDYEAGKWVEHAPLGKAMSYLAKIMRIY